VPFQVTDDRSVSAPMAPGPLIETNHSRRLDRIVGEAAEQTEKRVWATVHS
jgi:hypothetical protein